MSRLRPPPLEFQPIEYCDWAEISEEAPAFTLNAPKRRGRRLLGIKYERAGQNFFIERYGSRYFASPWLRYRSPLDGRIHWCQPDGVLYSAERQRITIIEFKYNHTELAWWQMFRLYRPVLERVFEDESYEICCCEVVKWFDPAVRTPMPVKLREHVETVAPDEFAVHIYAP